jgi:hypothetical protein
MPREADTRAVGTRSSPVESQCKASGGVVVHVDQAAGQVLAHDLSVRRRRWGSGSQDLVEVAGPVTRTQSRHSFRVVRTHRCVYVFACGARGGIFRIRTPASARTVSKAAVNVASRSRTRNGQRHRAPCARCGKHQRRIRDQTSRCTIDYRDAALHDGFSAVAPGRMIKAGRAGSPGQRGPAPGRLRAVVPAEADESARLVGMMRASTKAGIHRPPPKFPKLRGNRRRPSGVPG